ncbi:MAG: adenylate/guanylate cyclase with integral rane sensor [Actinomycetia bacterium]|nr:adenylate/guanylate cyclase with integral rane sensor [Actinomycetes bacterium]
MTGKARIHELRTWLDGAPDIPRAVLERQTRRLLGAALVAANMSGAVLVLVFATVVFPDPPNLAHPHQVQVINVAIFCSYFLLGAPVGVGWGIWLFRPIHRLAAHDRDLDEAEKRAVLRGPLRLMTLQAGLWGVGAVVWAAIDGWFGWLLSLKVGIITAIGGLMTCAAVYLLAERLLRPIAALALASGMPARESWFGVTPRTMLAWALGSGVPLAGMVGTGIAALAIPGMHVRQLALTILALGLVALWAGVQITYVASRAVADPVHAVSDGLGRVGHGDLTVSVPVYDASELGQLQAGFNEMVRGLRENAKLRDLFDRHVGEGVARHAIERGVELGGETCEAAVIFVDLAGSTRLAATRPPEEVVGLLNAYFGIVVDVVSRYGGLINKFQGDAALAIFGAPEPLDDANGRALGAARELTVRLQDRLPQLVAGIGISAGTVVAGHIGAEQRFEYTVIGDPVNEAARLSDLAKTSPDRVLAASTVLAGADPDEVGHWRLGSTVTLRGRTARTRLAVPYRKPPPRRRLGLLPRP